MDQYNPIHDWNAGKAAELYVNQLRWRARWRIIRHVGYPVGIALGVIALWLAHRL